jgi:hypothetical protein
MNCEEAGGGLHEDRGGASNDANGDGAVVVRKAVIEGRSAYVLVNNRTEGNAPLTVQALSELLRS